MRAEGRKEGREISYLILPSLKPLSRASYLYDGQEDASLTFNGHKDALAVSKYGDAQLLEVVVFQGHEHAEVNLLAHEHVWGWQERRHKGRDEKILSGERK